MVGEDTLLGEEDYVSGAAGLAVRTGETDTLGLYFGPTNVDIWRIAIEVDGNVVILSTDPSSNVRSPPIRSQMTPETSRLTTPQASISDSFSAPRAAP